MKKLIAISAFVLTAAAVQAQTPAQEPAKPATENPSQAVKPEDADKAQIKAEELPAAVKKTLEDQEYKGWLINSAWFDKKKERYDVELKNGADTQVVHFSAEGQRLDD